MPRHQGSRGPRLTGAALEDSAGAAGRSCSFELHDDFGWYAAAVFDVDALVPGRSRASVESDAATYRLRSSPMTIRPEIPPDDDVDPSRGGDAESGRIMSRRAPALEPASESPGLGRPGEAAGALRAHRSLHTNFSRQGTYHQRMPILSLSFDDDSEEPLFVFSGEDLLMAHIDEVDLDWEEVAERSILDERRGLVITQVAVLEELIDEFILYVTDPADPEGCQRRLDRKTIGPRIDELEKALRERDLLDAAGAGLIADLRTLVDIRNELAHGIIYRTLLYVIPVEELATRELPQEWRIYSRRSRASRRLTTAGLRENLEDAIGCFTALIAWGEGLVKQAPSPQNFREPTYFTSPREQ